MIHGHAFIKGAGTTKSYYPCGDLREIKGVVEMIDKYKTTIINLKNHGFLLMSSTLEGMQKNFKECDFEAIGGII